jgi:hypothetical protein
MLVRMQAMTVSDMGVMRGFFVVAVFVVIRSFTMMDRRFFVMLGGFAMMFSAFVSRRHEIVLRCDNDRKDRRDGDERDAVHRSQPYTPRRIITEAYLVFYDFTISIFLLFM